jgi:post-segregation antitoxin (ccd killing protein)
MRPAYDSNAPKRAVNMTLNEDLVRRARHYLAAEQKRHAEEEHQLDAAIAAWNDFDIAHGSFADEHSDL